MYKSFFYSFLIYHRYSLSCRVDVLQKSHQFLSIKSQELQGSENIPLPDAMLYKVLGVLLILLGSSTLQHCQGTQANLGKSGTIFFMLL